MTDRQTPPVHAMAQKLVVQGYLPLPFTLDAHDSRPLWDAIGLAQLFDLKADEFLELMQAQGPVHLAEDRGIPSSWKMMIEL